jgi:hypothetical protein
MKLLFPLLLIISINCHSQQFRIDSIGRVGGQYMELISKDTIYLYHWRGGIKKPKVTPGMIAVINPPTRRTKRKTISLIQ